MRLPNLFLSLALASAAKASVPDFPFVPSSTVALLRLSSLDRTYQSLHELLNSTSLPGAPITLPATLKALLLPSLPNLQSIDLDQPFYAAALLHASSDWAAPYVPGFLAAPHPALLLLLPGVSLLHLAQLPGLKSAHTGSPSHYLLEGTSLRVTLGAQGATGMALLGLQFYDLAAPPSTTLQLPSGAVATMRASVASLALELWPLDVLLRPLHLAGPSLLTLLDAALGVALEYSPELKAQLASWGLTAPQLGALAPILRDLLEVPLALARDTRALVLAASLQGPSGLHLGVHACPKPSAPPPKPSPSASASGSLWPDLPSLTSIMLATGDALSPRTASAAAASQAALEALSGALRAARTPPSPSATLLQELLELLHDLHATADGVQLAVVNGGAGSAVPAGSAGTALLPGLVAVFAKGVTAADVWRRHNATVRAMQGWRGMPWAAQGSSSTAASLSASGGGAAALLEVQGEQEELQLAQVAVSTRSIGGVAFESRTVHVPLLGAGQGALLQLDTAVGLVGGKVMALLLLSDAAALPFVQAAQRTPKQPAPPPFAALPGINATFSHLPRGSSSMVSMLALRPAALLAYYELLDAHVNGKPAEQHSDEAFLAELGRTLEGSSSAEDGTVGITARASEGGAVPAGMELHVDLLPYLRARQQVGLKWSAL